MVAIFKYRENELKTIAAIFKQQENELKQGWLSSNIEERSWE